VNKLILNAKTLYNYVHNPISSNCQKLHNRIIWYIILTTVENLQEYLFVSNLDLTVTEQ